jgi:hypothetical protein
MRIQDERNGESIKEQPAFAHTFRHVYQFILQATDGDTAAASGMFQQYLAGELSEELLALSRRWVQKDQRSGRTHRRVRRGWKASSPMRLGSRYVSGRTRDWLKMKNPDAPVVKREAEEDWSR